MKKHLLATATLLTGLAITPALAQTPVFVQWPLKRNNADSLQARQPATGVTPGTTTFEGYVLSNGQANVITSGSSAGQATTAYAPYSSIGQAFSTSATGASGSSTITSNPRPTFYEQFSITNSGTTALRVDSLIFTASVANSANGRAALQYSLADFSNTAARTDFAGGKGPNGVLPATNNGSFGAATGATTTPINLPQYSAGVASTFRMAFVNTGNGVTVPAGGTLAIRLSFRVGSDTEGRYFLLRNVILKSTQTALATRSAVATNLNFYPNPAQNSFTVPHTAAGTGAQVLVYNATGTRVLTQAVQPGSLETSLSLGALSHGLYLVEYADGDKRSTARLLKE